MHKLNRGPRALTAVGVLALSLVVGVPNALAGSGVNITPNATNLPGVGQAEDIVGSLLTVAVIAAVAGLALSATVWSVGNHSANPQIAGRGKTGVLVAAAAAILCGGAMAIVNFFFNIGAGIK